MTPLNGSPAIERTREVDAAPRAGSSSRTRHVRRDLQRRGARLVLRRQPKPPQAADARAGPYPDPDFRQLDSWIVIHEDDTATFYVGKTDCGQGTGTALPADDVRRAGLRLRQNHLHHGQQPITPSTRAVPAARPRWNAMAGP